MSWPAGRLVVGRDAWHAAQTDPAGFEPSPKRHIDEESMLLGAAEPATADVIAAVLGRVAEEARQVGGGPVGGVTLTHPAAWAAPRRQRLEEAARTVFPDVTLVSEPVAAASYVVERAGTRIPPGGHVVVYDFGAGTFDVSVVRAGGTGLEVVATEGLDDTGGLDVDAAIVDLLGRAFEAQDPAIWQRLAAPTTRPDQRARRILWDGVRTGKEILSRTTSTVLHVPVFDAEAPFGREELEAVARPILDRTIEATRRVLAHAGGDTPTGVFLVGGASRMPLAASLLHQALGVRPTLLDQPELVVAEGALYTMPPTDPVAAPADIPRIATPARTRRRVPVIAGTTAALLLATTLAVWAGNRDTPQGSGPAPSSPPASPSAAAPSVSPTPSIGPGLDPCLVGLWKQEQYGIDANIYDSRTRLTGYDTGTITYRPDGTYEIVYSGAPMGASITDGRWENVFKGTISGRYQTKDGKIVVSGLTAKGTSVLSRNGQVNNSTTMTGNTEPVEYTCTGTTLALHASFYDVELSRTTT
ncbi:Hsp70 family protein [Catenuloplanes japonicus]|uniref:Hsp70 family protein n=1 Tax=Catenuloplanes japonicus TaxID=33876 RepID=UPI000690C8A5|nr:Hsp70 family protein [Catenuloplanes japonicus]